jgi:hypothetical protein
MNKSKKFITKAKVGSKNYFVLSIHAFSGVVTFYLIILILFCYLLFEANLVKIINWMIAYFILLLVPVLRRHLQRYREGGIAKDILSKDYEGSHHFSTKSFIHLIVSMTLLIIMTVHLLITV